MRERGRERESLQNTFYLAHDFLTMVICSKIVYTIYLRKRKAAAGG